MRKGFGSIILDVGFRHLTPFLILYAVYVLVHGHYGPGGGFQAGALLGLAVVLGRVVQGQDAELGIGLSGGLVLACTGALIFLAIGLASLLWGGNFLDYGVLPIASAPAEARALGILGIEAGVTMGVMGVIIIMFDLLTRRGERE
jgi:multicomponent Na+:H+ antiporter subunit B